MNLPTQAIKSHAMTRPAPTLAFVIPCYNEEAVLDELLSQLKPVIEGLQASGKISGAANIVLVDDGSSDKTWEMIEKAAASGAGVTGIKLASNHGHQPALLAGLMSAKEDVLISMDADLQDDVAAIPKMLDAYAEGNEIVFGVRINRDTDTRFKRMTAKAYYDALASMGVDIIPDHADFRLMSRKSVEALREFGEVNLFLRGLIRRLGFQSTIVHYERKARFAGETKYPLGKMLALAVEGVTSFSSRPLRYVTWIGFAIAILSFLFALWAIVAKFTGLASVPGWASLIVPVYMLGGIQLIALGVIGEYIGKLYLEAKGRPQFIIDEIAQNAETPAQSENKPIN